MEIVNFKVLSIPRRLTAFSRHTRFQHRYAPRPGARLFRSTTGAAPRSEAIRSSSPCGLRAPHPVQVLIHSRPSAVSPTRVVQFRQHHLPAPNDLRDPGLERGDQADSSGETDSLASCDAVPEASPTLKTSAVALSVAPVSSTGANNGSRVPASSSAASTSLE